MKLFKLSAVAVMGLAICVVSVGASAAPKSANKSAKKSLSDILKSVEKQGYSDLTEASYDDHVLEIEALRDKKPVEIHVNPKSGKILSERPDERHIRLPNKAKSLRKIAKQLEKADYSRIESIDFERTGWEAEVWRGHQELEVTLDVKTGKVLSERVDD